MSTADASSDSVQLRDVAIVGGGCYGTFYAGQLIRARGARQARYRRLLIVDRDPQLPVRERSRRGRRPGAGRRRLGRVLRRLAGARCTRRRAEARRRDRALPADAASHVRLAGAARPRPLARRAWSSGAPCRSVPAHPTMSSAPDLTRYVSFADWLCPTHCIEPATCPVIRAPRTWEMSEALERLTDTAGGARPRPPDPCSSSAGIGCTASACSTSRRCWRGTASSPRPGRPTVRWTWSSGPCRPATAPPACCTSANSLRYGAPGRCGNPCAFYICAEWPGGTPSASGIG